MQQQLRITKDKEVAVHNEANEQAQKCYELREMLLAAHKRLVSLWLSALLALLGFHLMMMMLMGTAAVVR